ncbi:hypothetical protein KAR91_72480, partial [Candidatus Pacearchaeota archaeon]|nr:hypothetical protein [Candidatus Pacearchaeota archaeon]
IEMTRKQIGFLCKKEGEKIKELTARNKELYGALSNLIGGEKAKYLTSSNGKKISGTFDLMCLGEGYNKAIEILNK